MIYRPGNGWTMWDSWLFPWRGRYHLFYLETHEDLWDHVGHAVSDDLIHWQARPSIPTKGAPDAWNHSPTLTGSVIERDGTFYLFVGAVWAQQQVVGVYTSRDLDSWTPYPKNPVLRAAGHGYRTEPLPPQFNSVDWRDPGVFYNPADQHYHAFLCARSDDDNPFNGSARVAHVRSRALLDWEVLPPVDLDLDGFYHAEVPDYFELEGRSYLLFSTVTRAGLSIHTPSRRHSTGTYYAIGDGLSGPYSLPSEPLLIGSGEGRMGPYVGRTIPYDGGRLLYHHIAGKRPTWGAPKRVLADTDGRLRLHYWQGIDGLATCEQKVRWESVHATGNWHLNGQVMHGHAIGGCARRPVVNDADDIHCRLQLRAQPNCQVSIIFRARDDRGIMLTFDFAHHELECTLAQRDVADHCGWGGCDIRDRCHWALAANQWLDIRCLLRAEHMECYVDSEWAMTTVFEEHLNSGSIELQVTGGETQFRELRVMQLEGMD